MLHTTYALRFAVLAAVLIPAGTRETIAADDTAIGKAAAAVATSQSWRPFNDCIALIDESWELPAADSGIVAEISVKESQTVEPGQVIAKLDQQQAESAVSIAQLRYEIALLSAKDSGEVDVAVLAVGHARKKLQEYDRLQENSVSKSKRDDLVMNLNVAIANQNRKKLELAQATMQSRMLETQVLASKDLLSRRTIRTREPGIVTEIKKNADEWVREGETIAIVANYTELGVDVSVDYASVDLSKIVGTKIRVQPVRRLEDEPIWLQGEVTSYEAKVSGRGLIRLHCKFRNAFHRGEYVVLPGAQINLEMATIEARSRLSRLP